MNRFIKYVFYIVAVCGLFVACNKEQDKIGWEPEVAAPLALLSVDLNKEIDLVNYSKSFFELVGTQAKQNDIVYTAIVNGLADSVKKRLPRYLQSNIDTFVYRKEHLRPIPDYMASALLMDMFDNFEKNSSISAINSFTYYILTGLPDQLQKMAKDSLYHMKLDIPEDVGIDMKAINDRADKMQWLKLQLAVNTRLRINGRIQVYLRDEAGYIYDSLFRVDNNGNHEGQMPFTGMVSDVYKQRVIRDYPTPEEAKKTVNVHTISVAIKSDSLCLDTSLIWLKDLHNRKINASIGLMLKMNMDDMIEKK